MEQSHDQTNAKKRQTEENETDVKTVFITGLPSDVKPREIYLLFRTTPGYMFCQIKNMQKSSQVFATFESHDMAVHAINTLHGFQFDPDFPFTLKMELAKATSKTLRSGDHLRGRYPPYA
eukprot:TRINITY_DN959_c0_g1_i3.p1 TRINITY_DN959_c0_g1~~TRINITY_DN959_c0_g1_i3.p1  ORF type:complete len:120 (+),score=18.89 TRINITY_DN959_c0_g1_i3:50-409(+)